MKCLNRSKWRYLSHSWGHSWVNSIGWVSQDRKIDKMLTLFTVCMIGMAVLFKWKTKKKSKHTFRFWTTELASLTMAWIKLVNISKCSEEIWRLCLPFFLYAQHHSTKKGESKAHMKMGTVQHNILGVTSADNFLPTWLTYF